MSEIGLTWDGEDIDLSFDADPLESAALISLFTDGRVAVEELPQGETDRRGFWGDALSQGTKTGSRLWLLGREKKTPEVLRLHEDYAREALQWGTAAQVSGAYDDRNGLVLKITINGQRVKVGGAPNAV